MKTSKNIISRVSKKVKSRIVAESLNDANKNGGSTIHSIQNIIDAERNLALIYRFTGKQDEGNTYVLDVVNRGYAWFPLSRKWKKGTKYLYFCTADEVYARFDITAVTEKLPNDYKPSTKIMDFLSRKSTHGYIKIENIETGNLPQDLLYNRSAMSAKENGFRSCSGRLAFVV